MANKGNARIADDDLFRILNAKGDVTSSLLGVITAEVFIVKFTYARVSTRKQFHDGNGLEDQIAQFKISPQI